MEIILKCTINPTLNTWIFTTLLSNQFEMNSDRRGGLITFGIDHQRATQVVLNTSVAVCFVIDLKEWDKVADEIYEIEMKTIIQQEIERQESRKHDAIVAFDDRKVDRIDEIISVLESLLEPEKEQMIDFARDYYSEIASLQDPFSKSPRTYFNEQFKPE